MSIKNITEAVQRLRRIQAGPATEPSYSDYYPSYPEVEVTYYRASSKEAVEAEFQCEYTRETEWSGVFAAVSF